MFYKYESDFDNDLMFWSNATADLWHKGEIGESDLPDELLHALNELWTDSHLVCCYLVEFKGRYGVALESIYDRDFAESLGVTYNRCAVYGCRRPLDYSQRSSADNRSVIDPFGIDLYLPAISYLHISCSSLRHFWRDVGSAVFCAVGHGGGSLHLVPNFSKSWKPHSSLCCFMRIRSGNRL